MKHGHETRPSRQAFPPLATEDSLTGCFGSILLIFKNCGCQSRSSRGRRQAANEQLAVNHPPKLSPPHFRRLSHLGGRGGCWGEQSLAFREDTPKQGHSIRWSTAQPSAPGLGVVTKIAVCRRRGREGTGFGRAAHPSLPPAAWEGHLGTSLLGPAGHGADVTGFQTPTPRVPDHAPAVTLDGCGLSPVPRSSGRGAS